VDNGSAPPLSQLNNNFQLYQLQLDKGYIPIGLQARNRTRIAIGSRGINALIDTGASINAIPKSMLDGLDPSTYGKRMQPRISHCYLADNTPVVISEMVDLHLRMGDMDHVVPMHVLPMGLDLILGLDFLKQAKCIFDCTKNILYVRKPVGVLESVGSDHGVELCGHFIYHNK